MIKITNDGKPCDGKLSRTVWGGGKLGDNIKRLPIVKNVYPATFCRGGIHRTQWQQQQWKAKGWGFVKKVCLLYQII